MTENNTLAPAGIGTLLRPIVTPDVLLEAQDEITKLITKALKEGRDYGPVPGGSKNDDGSVKQMLLKPGAESLLLAFGLYPADEVLESEIDHDREFKWIKKKKEWYGPQGNRQFKWVVEEGFSQGLYRYVTQTKLYNRHTGELVGTGIAACSTMESKYIDRPRDSENTVLRIACKRSMVAAVLVTFRLSDRFTADMETADSEEEQVKVEPVKVETEEEKAERLRAKAEADAFRFLRELSYTTAQIDIFVSECKEAGFEKWQAIALQAKAKGQDAREYLHLRIEAKRVDPANAALISEEAPEPTELVGDALAAAAAEVAQP